MTEGVFVDVGNRFEFGSVDMSSGQWVGLGDFLMALIWCFALKN